MLLGFSQPKRIPRYLFYNLHIKYSPMFLFYLKLQMEESRRRITRNAPEKSGHLKEDAYTDKFLNITQDEGKLFLFFEKAPILKIKDEKKAE